jgi:SAM-dependent methyltransferase
MESRSYTSQWHGWRALLLDLLRDYRAHRNTSECVLRRIEDAQFMEHRAFARRLSGCDILDVGPGQVPVQLSYFNLLNRAIGIDVNRIIEHRTPSALLMLAKEDGIVRALKTFGRWALGVDSRTRRAVRSHLGVRKMAWPEILRMDVRDLRFPDASFEFIYSRSVFQHIPNPEVAIREIRRTLRPGGVTFISLHLWTCPNGYTYVPAPAWEWPHLRGLAKPADIDQSRNRLRLAQWRSIFDGIMPDAEFHLRGPETPEMITRAMELSKGELREYSLEELVNYEASVLWRKPL